MPANGIVAQPAPLTGSIGIFGGKVAIGKTLAKVGVTTATVQSGRNASVFSPFEPVTPEQRTKVMEHMNVFYDAFVEKAAVSRRTTPAQIDAVAQGRVWTGRQARERGLVDELGGLDTAVAIAKQRAGIPSDEDVELIVYPPRRTRYEALAQQFGSSGPDVRAPLARGVSWTGRACGSRCSACTVGSSTGERRRGVGSSWSRKAGAVSPTGPVSGTRLRQRAGSSSRRGSCSERAGCVPAADVAEGTDNDCDRHERLTRNRRPTDPGLAWALHSSQDGRQDSPPRPSGERAVLPYEATLAHCQRHRRPVP